MSDFELNTETRLCSEHFTRDDFKDTQVRKCLKPNVVPSVFKHSADDDQEDRLHTSKHQKTDHCHHTNQFATSITSSTETVITYPTATLQDYYEEVATTSPTAETILPSSSATIPTATSSHHEQANTVEEFEVPVFITQVTSTQKSSHCSNCVKLREKISEHSRICSDFRKEIRYWKARCTRLLGTNETYKYNNSRLNRELRQKSSFEPPDNIKFLFNNVAKNCKRAPRGRRYEQQMREFALTIHHLSPRAYRQLMPLLYFPSERIVRLWCSVLKCNPGFFPPVFASLQEKTVPGGELEGNEDVTLLCDGMHIKKAIIWDPGLRRAVGTVDYGGITAQPEQAELATESCILQVVGVRTGWKIAIGYILAVGTPEGKVLSEILKAAIKRLSAIGINVLCITMDGAAQNVAALKNMGANLLVKNPENMKPTILHPEDKTKEICVMLDPPHMLKLCRNALSKYKVFKSDKGEIKWQHIVNLHNLQEQEGLRLAPQLSARHIYYTNLNMKVYIAGQTICRHNGDALRNLKDAKYELPPGYDFSDTEATIEFCYNINDLYDITNSHNRHKSQPFHKKPITPYNIKDKEKHLTRLITYLVSLKNIDGKPLYQTRRKTFVIGFISAALSIIKLSHMLFQQPLNQKPHFMYLCTYRLQQDVLEHLIGNLRGSGGFSNNPTAVNIKYRLRKNVLVNNIMPSVHGNCRIYGETGHSSLFKIGTKQQVDVYEEDIPEVLLNLSDQLDSTLSGFVEDILYYMCGYIVRVVSKHMKCSECLKALLHSSHFSDHPYVIPKVDGATTNWTELKNNGGLTYASAGVLKIIRCSEKVFRIAQNTLNLNLDMLVYLVTQELSTANIFPDLEAHVDDSSESEDLHSTQLIKTLCGKYLETRIKTWCKKQNINFAVMTGHIRQRDGRRILYSNL